MVMRRLAWIALPLTLLATGGLFPAQASAYGGAQRDSAIVLPGATSAEGIARGAGSTFYAGDLFAGDIFRGDVRRGTAKLFIDAPQGRQALGMKASVARHLLFVAGGFTGHGYVYDTRTGASVADFAFGAANSSVINDVALAPGGAWFTDSVQPKLYFVPFGGYGKLGAVKTLTVTGPAAAITGDFNMNGIDATPNGKTLVVAHSANAALYTVNPETGASALIAGVSVPNVDGIVLRGHRLWAVQNFSNQVSRIKLNAAMTSGTVEKVITSKLFQVPTTAALFGDTLAVVNAKFDTGLPPTASQYEVILTSA
jgi:sugar lactone lactonase YvrE